MAERDLVVQSSLIAESDEAVTVEFFFRNVFVGDVTDVVATVGVDGHPVEHLRRGQVELTVGDVGKIGWDIQCSGAFSSKKTLVEIERWCRGGKILLIVEAQ